LRMRKEARALRAEGAEVVVWGNVWAYVHGVRAAGEGAV
jgi:hypothetical protein